MFVLSFGMQKAFEDLIRRGVIPGVGCFPWSGWESRVELLISLAEDRGPFVLNSHGLLTAAVRGLIATSGAKPTCSLSGIPETSSCR